MKKLKIYECIIKDNLTAYVEIIPAWNKKELLDQWGGNGDFVSIKDVSKDYPISIDCVQNAITGRFGIQEQDIIRRALQLVLLNTID